MTGIRIALAVATSLLAASPLMAQTENVQPKRARIKAGAQLVPSYPGSKDHSVQPLVGFSRAKAGHDFDFSAADQSGGFTVVRGDHFSAGPAVALQGERSRSDTGNLLPKVSTTVELGGFAQYETTHFRLRGDLRQGIGGHKGLVGSVGADFIARDHDNWLFAIGPRVNLSDSKFQRAYFGVPVAVPAAGLPAYRPGGGVYSYGATATALYALTPRWGVTGYAKYERLVGDAGRSPVVRTLGDRNQTSGGLALTYTF